MSYRSPVADILFSLKHVADFDDALASGLFVSRRSKLRRSTKSATGSARATRTAR
jgi:hypothetical protein